MSAVHVRACVRACVRAYPFTGLKLHVRIRSRVSNCSVRGKGGLDREQSCTSPILLAISSPRLSVEARAGRGLEPEGWRTQNSSRRDFQSLFPPSWGGAGKNLYLFFRFLTLAVIRQQNSS